MVLDCKEVCIYPNGAPVFQISKVDFIPFDQMSDASRKYTNGIKKLLQEHSFYFCLDADITQSLQAQAKKLQQTPEQSEVNLLYSNKVQIDERYVWNR